MRKVPLPESDSDHMHRCAMCALLLSQPPDPRDDYSADAERFHPDQAAYVKNNSTTQISYGFLWYTTDTSKIAQLCSKTVVAQCILTVRRWKAMAMAGGQSSAVEDDGDSRPL